MNTGVVLSGGKSTRMKTDKCLLNLNNKCLTQYVIDSLRAVTDNIIISSSNITPTLWVSFGQR